MVHGLELNNSEKSYKRREKDDGNEKKNVKLAKIAKTIMVIEPVTYIFKFSKITNLKEDYCHITV